MTPEERARKVESYGNAYVTLAEGLQHFPREMWHFKPENGWSIREIIVHIADSEANSYVRCRRFIAEPGSGVYGYDGDTWAAGLNYQAQDVEVALALFEQLRKATYLLIRTLPDSVWSNTVEHSESGTMGMDRWLEIYESHVREHLEQMQSVYEEWKKSPR